MQLLRKSKIWFGDGTFDVVNEPYMQLYSLHAFVRSGESQKQMPLVFILMSRRQIADYEAVFRRLLVLVTEIGGEGKCA